MNENEVLNNNITETDVPGNEVEPAKEATITMSELDFNKRIQSERSTSKNELLKELGIKSVKEFTELKASYETAINSAKSLEDNITNLNKDKTKLQEDLLIARLGVDEKHKDDLLTLAKSKVNDTNSLEDVAKDLLNSYPQFKAVKEPFKMGTDRAIGTESGKKVSEEMAARFPWLAD